MIGAALASVLELAPGYSRDASPLMSLRDEAVGNVTVEVRRILHERLGISDDVLQVAAGGRQTSYSPIPWVRVFDPSHSPRATVGYYVVLLFAADGSSVYLSLNQGTSEWRGNKWRPLTQADSVRERASLGRAALSNWNSQVLRSGEVEPDLRAASTSVGPESQQRARNYELASIAAYRYDAVDLPTDEAFADDLAEVLALLWDLQSFGGFATTADPTSPAAVSGSAGPTSIVARRGSRQGRRVDAAANKAIEVHAVAIASAQFAAQGWQVRHVGGDAGTPFDLECVRDGVELRVEVKGTTSRGTEITLTPNEVKHARSYQPLALVVVSEIDLDNDTYATSGGVTTTVDPWFIEESRLVPSAYAYRVMPAGSDASIGQAIATYDG